MGQNSCLTWCQSLSFQEVMSSNFNVFFIFPHLLSTHAKKAADEEVLTRSSKSAQYTLLVHYLTY